VVKHIEEILERFAVTARHINSLIRFKKLPFELLSRFRSFLKLLEHQIDHDLRLTVKDVHKVLEDVVVESWSQELATRFPFVVTPKHLKN
jgi:glutathionylspermidine synthase